MRIRLVFAIAAVSVALATAPPATASTFYVTTGTTGEFSIAPGFNTNWTITADAGQTVFGGGVFMMRHTAGVTVGITLEIFDAGGGGALAAVMFPDGSYVGETYQRIAMLVDGGGYTLPGPGDYIVKLLVLDDGGQSDTARYDIQGDVNALMLDSSNPDTILQPAQAGVDVPEPAGAALLAVGLLGLGLSRRRAAA